MGTCSSSLLMEHSVPFRVYKTDNETERKEKETKNGERMSSQVTQENDSDFS